MQKEEARLLSLSCSPSPLSHPPKCTPSKLAFKRRFSSSARQQFHQPPAHHPSLHFDTSASSFPKVQGPHVCLQVSRVHGLLSFPDIWDSQGGTATPSSPILKMHLVVRIGRLLRCCNCNCTKPEAIVLPPQPLFTSASGSGRPPTPLAFGPDVPPPATRQPTPG